MTKRMIASLVLLLAAMLVTTLAQQLPPGDPKNDQFLVHFEAVKKANLGIRDFYQMQEGIEYNLPNGNKDRLEKGDINGIWGREYQKWYSNPVTSGPPVVQGGIQPNETQRPNDHFDSYAASRHATRIGPIESGTIVGEGTIGYADGTTRPYRITTPLRAYRAKFRKDGTEETFVTLQGCMNPVNYGGELYQGFVFTPDQPQPVKKTVDGGVKDTNLGAAIVAGLIGLIILGSAIVAFRYQTALPATALVPTTPVVAEKTDAEVVASPVTSDAEVPLAETKEADPVIATEIKVSKRTFISYTPQDQNGPNMLRFNGVKFHSIDIDKDGTVTIRFSGKGE